MENNTKAKINLHEGIIELEGNEDFVAKYLDLFSSKINLSVSSLDSKSTKSLKVKEEKPKKKQSVTNDNSTKKVRTPQKIDVEEFDIRGNSKDIPSLKDYLAEKKPGSNHSEKILVIGHYITNFLKCEEFSEGNIEFAYKVLKMTPRPKHLHQSHLDAKNKKFWLDAGSDSSHWKLSRVGEMHVEDDMPEKMSE